MRYQPQTSADYETLYEQLKHAGSWTLALVTEITTMGVEIAVVNPCIIERLDGVSEQQDGMLFIGYPGRSIGMMRIHPVHSNEEKEAFIRTCEHHKVQFTPIQSRNDAPL